jgi:uncharacterized protein (DUF1499 family)
MHNKSNRLNILPILFAIIWGLILALAMFMINGCSGKGAGNMDMDAPGLRDCPKSPNCVCSEAGDKKHAVDPFHLKGDPGVSWPLIRDEIASMPRCTLVAATRNYLHAECRSRVFGFVDDLELYLNSSGGIISVRSAARTGYSDFGVNRRRVERLGNRLRAKQLIK